MARMHVMEQSESQAIMSSMHQLLEKRLSERAEELLHTDHFAWEL